MLSMPRRKISYTHEYPYHVFARSNNKENFYLDIEDVWHIFYSHINELKYRFHCEVYAFVLMSNHYHLLLKTPESVDLGKIMHWFQMSISRKINSESERINHVFGGPYQCSQITTNIGFQNVFKYIYRNPIKANLCSKVEEYRYSLLNRDVLKVTSEDGLVVDLALDKSWLNEPTSAEYDEIVRKGLTRGIYKPCARSMKKLDSRFLTQGLAKR